MTSEKICFSIDLAENQREYCKTASELFNSTSMYIMLERFGNIAIKENPEHKDFLNTYFSDEGYVDIWRIPNLLLDMVNGNNDSHVELFTDEYFRIYFLRFIGAFYNYFMKKTSIFNVDDVHVNDYNYNVLNIRKNQLLYNLITEAYCKICESINNFEEIQRGA